MIRNRKHKDNVIERVKQLDAFPKLKDEYLKKNRFGGIISIISRILIIYIIYLEVKFYMDKRLIFKFAPDVDLHARLKINIDLTVAMPCKAIGADILDSTNQNTYSFGQLEEEDTWWEMSSEQRQHFEYMQHLNRYLSEEYHSIAEVLYKVEKPFDYLPMPERTMKPIKPFDSCRVHGSLTLNKVAGNFHITAGKSIHFPRGHLHLNFMFEESNQNFTHRINKFSFGDQTAGMVQPLEFEEKILENERTMVLYYLEIVPTTIETFLTFIKSYQYSVKENVRTIDHDSGSHGVPGLYFKYDMSALKVNVLINRESLIKLTIRLCSVIAGVVHICGFVNFLIQFICDKFIKSFAPKPVQYQKMDTQNTIVHKNLLTKNLIFDNNFEPADHVPISLTSQ